MKYTMQVEVEAEQFLPSEDKIPKGVISDGPRSPKDDARSSWILHTQDGTSYMRDGDYVVTTAEGNRYIMQREVFEKIYTPGE
jgi:hypothetical protein